ncbi:hypothetical protein TorRG33x02_199390 [Trema orientale]|uniref:Uncharacterized protein n=1 Tax=Trema orientale TaxID=63057 RepID=A0A2P5EFH7_TREOI|nr:hypothetical protein TorRG33x02_199390 [Trema orientale]
MRISQLKTSSDRIIEGVEYQTIYRTAIPLSRRARHGLQATTKRESMTRTLFDGRHGADSINLQGTVGQAQAKMHGSPSLSLINAGPKQ